MWLKLTLADGSPILMNMNEWSWAMADDDGRKLIFYKDNKDESSEEVLETFEEVWAMMKNSC